MTIVQPILHALAYELGENAHSYSEVFDFQRKLTEFDLSDDPELWGWGTFYKTARSRAELAATAAQNSLDSAELDRTQIDAVIVCGVSFPEMTFDQALYCGDLLARLGLGNCFVVGASLLRCNTMLACIELGAALIKSEMYRHVLVIACDIIREEIDRFRNFALFSDSAACCILSADARSGYVFRASATALDPKEMGREGDISGSLGRAATERVFGRADILQNQVCKAFPPNLFRPIILYKERQAGFAPDQLFLDNIPTRSHCFSADCIINLHDHEQQVVLPAGSKIVLCSSISGFRSTLLFETKLETDLGSNTNDRSGTPVKFIAAGADPMQYRLFAPQGGEL